MSVAYYSIALNYGYNFLVFDGPGQGYAARFQNLYFIPNYEFVVSQVIDYVISSSLGKAGNIVLWGVSFGGFFIFIYYFFFD